MTKNLTFFKMRYKMRIILQKEVMFVLADCVVHRNDSNIRTA